MPHYQQDDIVLVLDRDEENEGGTPAVLCEIFGGEALVKMNGKDSDRRTVDLRLVQPFYRTPMQFAH